MVLIRLGDAAPVRPARRVRFGAAEMLALQESLEQSHPEVTLPEDLRVEVDVMAAALAEVDVAALTAQARALLVEHGVLGPEAPVAAVLANLAALTSEPLRVRTSLSGSRAGRLGWHWVGAELGGSLTREDGLFELSLFDARTIGDELLRGIPLSDSPDEREPWTVPLDALGPLAQIDGGVDPAVQAGLGGFLGLDAEATATALEWAQGVRAVLHMAARPRAEAGLPPTLLWVQDHRGWWAAEPAAVVEAPREGRRTVTWVPAGEAELRSAIGTLLTGAWF